MTVSRHSIFRDKALKHYTRGKRKDVLPSFSSIPVALFVWLLLALIAVAGLFVQYAQVPVYLSGADIILGSGNQVAGESNEATTVAFIPTASPAHLRAGLEVQLQTGDTTPLTGTVVAIEPGTISLAKAFAEYKLNNTNSSLANQSAVLLLIRTSGPSFPADGSALALNINTGTESLFSALL